MAVILVQYAGWLARGLTSATSYTVIGVANKFFTVLLSVIFLSKHASVEGILALLVCIIGASQYRQAGMRDPLQSHK